MDLAIKTIDVCKDFMVGNTPVKVLKDINLEIEKGSFYSIMGPSGSGKSTLLYLLGGLDSCTSGSILINGKDISHLKDSEESKIRRRDIGFVFQFYNLIPNLNVEENILLPILLDGKNKKNYKDDLDEILELVGLQGRKKYVPSELSGGQQQRVAIARALINKPDIIFADEPIGNLDSKTGVEIMELFRKINIKQNKTIVQVTHSKESSMYGTHLINVKDGHIVR